MLKKNIKITKGILAPSKGEHSIIPNQFKWRTEKVFIGDSEIVIADNKEAIWWNRPLTSDTMCKLEADGLYSYNLPFWQGEKLLFKTGYNVILNKNSVPVAIHIKTDETWTDGQKTALRKMLYTCLYNTLLELGVNENDLGHHGNDFYFQGRKFSCSEQIFENDVFTQNVIITLQMLPEKDIFDRLTGKYAHSKTITGIIEEAPHVSKEAFIDTLHKNVSDYVKEYINK